MIVLGIESSCDESSVALIASDKTILAAELFSQMNQHEIYGGVVPEIAARAHLSTLPPMIQRVLEKAGLELHEIDAVAATTGPGLIGGLVVGATLGKTLAFSLQKPFLAVNHLEAHALSPRLIQDVAFPYLLLLVSGGHTQLVLIRDVGDYKLLGTTIDDAAGEAFDKVAKLLGLPYPGGPQIEKLAAEGNAAAYNFPRPLKGEPQPNFSFSGLKTSVRYMREKNPDAKAADVAASFQAAMVETLGDRVEAALRLAGPVTACVCAGGVAANQAIRQILKNICSRRSIEFIAPPLWLCTDNAQMVAWAGIERLQRGWVDDLSIKARPRWPLEEMNHA